jgi:hypothetical protein
MNEPQVDPQFDERSYVAGQQAGYLAGREQGRVVGKREGVQAERERVLAIVDLYRGSLMNGPFFRVIQAELGSLRAAIAAADAAGREEES